MVIFMIIGAIDKCMGNKYGYVGKFEEGFMAMGVLTIAMVGVVSLAPILAMVLNTLVGPLHRLLGAVIVAKLVFCRKKMRI